MPYPYTPFSLITVLEKHFEDPVIKAECQRLALERIQHNIQNRLFDDFPPLISEEIAQVVSQEFISMVRHVILFNKYDEEKLNEDEKTKFQQWVEGLTQLAYEQLLDSEGKVKDELLKLLGIEAYKNQLKNNQIIHAFIGNTTGVAVDNNKIEVYEIGLSNPHPMSMINLMVNRNYRVWCDNLLEKFGVKLDIIYSPENTRKSNNSNNNTPATVGVIGGGIIAAAATIAITLFAVYNKPNDSSPAPDLGNTPQRKR